MVTGVETAGLVLASIPLVVSALEHYVEGVDTIGKWWRYKRELRGLARVLDAENVRFLNTCEILLGGLVSSSEVDILVQNPGGIQWKDIDLDKKLRKRLHRSYSSYLLSVEDMAEALKDLTTKLNLDSGKSQWDTLPRIKREFQRAKFTLLRQQYEELIRRIERNNDTLDSLTTQNLKLEPVRQRQRHSALRFKAIQQHAQKLYHLINVGLTCECEMPHNARLHLDSRLSDATDCDQHLYQGLATTAGVQFKVVFSTESGGVDVLKSLPWSWQETKIRPLTLLDDISVQSIFQEQLPAPTNTNVPGKQTPSSGPKVMSSAFRRNGTPKKAVSSASSSTTLKAPDPSVPAGKSPDLDRIESLCFAMQHCMNQVMDHERCLGYLSDDKWQRLGVYLPMAGSGRERSITPLAQLLSIQDPQHNQLLATTGHLGLSRADRVGLALTVASSVLQLYNTPWLRENFSKDDILIDNESTGKLYEQAYVGGTFPASTAQGLDHPKSFLPVVRNETLFALGLVLIELCLSQPLENLRSPEDPLDAYGKANVVTNFCTAKRMEAAVYREGGIRYGDVVRRCIYCDFDQRQTDMDNEGFRQAVYDGVVAPLEDDLRGFY